MGLELHRQAIRISKFLYWFQLSIVWFSNSFFDSLFFSFDVDWYSHPLGIRKIHFCECIAGFVGEDWTHEKRVNTRSPHFSLLFRRKAALLAVYLAHSLSEHCAKMIETLDEVSAENGNCGILESCLHTILELGARVEGIAHIGLG